MTVPGVRVPRRLAAAVALAVGVAALTLATTLVLGLRAEVRRLEARLAERERTTLALRRELAEVRERLAAETGARRALGAERDRLRAALAGARRDVERLETALARAETERRRLAARLAEAMREGERLLAKLASVREARVAAERQLRGLRWRVRRAERRVAELEAERRRTAAALAAWLGRRREALARLFERAGLDPADFAEPGDGRGGPLLPPRSEPGSEADVEALLGLLAHTEDLLRRLPVTMPVAGARLTSRFGNRRDPLRAVRAFHAGLDFAAPRGTRVRAPAAGVVRFAGRRGAFGRLVEIDHGGGLVTRFAHLSRILVRRGARVRRGEPVGVVGSSGRSTGPHLHYEVRVDGRAVDPLTFLDAGRELLAQP